MASLSRFPALDNSCTCSRAWNLLHVFPRWIGYMFPAVENAVATCILPHLIPVAYFPTLGTECKFSLCQSEDLGHMSPRLDRYDSLVLACPLNFPATWEVSFLSSKLCLVNLLLLKLSCLPRCPRTIGPCHSKCFQRTVGSIAQRFLKICLECSIDSPAERLSCEAFSVSWPIFAHD